MKKILFLTFWALLCWQVAAPQDHRQLNREKQANRRIALVIGNGEYTRVPRLQNPANDAKLVATTLTKLGFEVITATDQTQRQMKQAIREFGTKLRSGSTVGVFYFAGHGVQAKGHNYLIPVDADIQTEADLEDTAVDLNYVLNTIDDAQNALNIAILDACRNNPFARSFRSTQLGLAQVVAPTGTLIAYATAPNSVAADGRGENSPYTEELIKQIEKPGVLLETMFRRVTEQVSARTGGAQEPWYSANVKGDFYFVSGALSSNVNVQDNVDTALPDSKPTSASSVGSLSVEDFQAKRVESKQGGPGGVKFTIRPQLKSVVIYPYSIVLESCKMTGLDVICELKLTNDSSSAREFALSHDDYRLRRRGADATKAITEDGNQYKLSESIIGSASTRSSLFNRAVLSPKVAVRMVLTFRNVTESSFSFSLLRLAVYQESSNTPSKMQYFDFSDVMLVR